MGAGVALKRKPGGEQPPGQDMRSVSLIMVPEEGVVKGKPGNSHQFTKAGRWRCWEVERTKKKGRPHAGTAPSSP